MEIYNCAILYLLIYLCTAILYLLKPVYLHTTRNMSAYDLLVVTMDKIVIEL
jgi:hypothetical protein